MESTSSIEVCHVSSKARKQLTIVLFTLFVIPALILIGIIPFGWRMYVLTAIAGAFGYVAFLQGFSLHDVGIRTDNLKQALAKQIPIVIFFLLMLGLAPTFGLIDRKFIPSTNFFVFYIFVSSPCQEFIYRSYLCALAKRSNASRLVMLMILILPYVFVHIIYRDVLTLAFTFFVGAFWAISYTKHENLFAVSLSHALLGVMTLSLGLV